MRLTRCWEAKSSAVKNFEKETYRDVEGDEIPKEKMLIFELADKTRVAVRGSGTEPKIKYYLFAQRRPESGIVRRERAAREVKPRLAQKLESLWEWLQSDAQKPDQPFRHCPRDGRAVLVISLGGGGASSSFAR